MTKTMGDNNEVISLAHMKHDWFEKGKSLVTVTLYIRNAVDVDIIFEEDGVNATFCTSDATFLKWHANGALDKKYFSYVIKTREEIICKESYFKVKAATIEIFLKKVSPGKWGSLHAYGTESIKDGKKSPHQQAMLSRQLLLGGKSTPLTKKSSDEGKQEVETEKPGPSKTQDKRNIQKSVAVSLQSDVPFGMVGLENYANNCYMNVVVQVLSNIQEARDYFKNDCYFKDINSNNPLGSGGKVAKAFADVVKTLWSNGKKVFKPVALKNVMGKQCSLFVGWQQHDAQEFFASLLDNLHEDLNQIQYEKASEKDLAKLESEPSANEKPDTAWLSHLKRNNSFMVKLFHGQLMSKLTCAACHKISYSFDPCAQISLPIPSNKQQHKVLFFTRDIQSTPYLINLQISTANAQLWHLINLLQSIVKVPPHLISMFKGINDVTESDQLPITSVKKYKYIICSEIASKDEIGVISIPVFQYTSYAKDFMECDFCFKLQRELETKLKRCTRCLSVAYCSRDCQTKHWHTHSKVCSKDLKKAVGIPFYITLSKETLSYQSLVESLREVAKHSVERVNHNIDNLSKSDTCLSENNVKNTLHSCNFIIKTSSKMNFIDETCVAVTADNLQFESLLKATCLIMEWQNNLSEDQSVNDVRSKEVANHEIFSDPLAPQLASDNRSDQSTLSDCIKLFMEPERLDEKESWKCPKCKSPQSAKKEMAISSPPSLLLLHFKRFTYGEYGQKINKAVSYPLSEFDLSPFVAKETLSKLDYSLLYDLVGVITHRGTMRMGHYTCMTRLLNHLNQEEYGWRHFDDDSVVKIRAEKVVSPDAYVLIYRIRNLNDVIKLDRCPALHSSSASSLTDGVVKRKRADNTTSGSKSVDRRSHSEYTLNRLKRTTSVEANESENEKKSADNASSRSELLRSNSAHPILNSSVRCQESLEHSATSTDRSENVTAHYNLCRLSSTSSEEFVDCSSHLPQEDITVKDVNSSTTDSLAQEDNTVRHLNSHLPREDITVKDVNLSNDNVVKIEGSSISNVQSEATSFSSHKNNVNPTSEDNVRINGILNEEGATIHNVATDDFNNKASATAINNDIFNKEGATSHIENVIADDINNRASATAINNDMICSAAEFLNDSRTTEDLFDYESFEDLHLDPLQEELHKSFDGLEWIDSNEYLNQEDMTIENPFADVIFTPSKSFYDIDENDLD